MLSQMHTARVAEAFDSVAERFEATLENDITRGIRSKLYTLIDSLVLRGSEILDINCGIGIDAVELAQKGYRVTGADLAPNMIQQARLRSRQYKQNIEFIETSFEDLSLLSGKTFDLVLSNFGGLNCVPLLNRVVEEVTRVVKPGGYFIAVVMPRVSLWELVAGITRLNFGFAFRRLPKNVQATGFDGKQFTVTYYSPRAFAAAFSRSFKVEQVRGLNVISPPPHATKFAARFQRLSHWLEQIEDACASLPLFRSVGDHFVMVLRRTR